MKIFPFKLYLQAHLFSSIETLSQKSYFIIFFILWTENDDASIRNCMDTAKTLLYLEKSQMFVPGEP